MMKLEARTRLMSSETPKDVYNKLFNSRQPTLCIFGRFLFSSKPLPPTKEVPEGWEPISMPGLPTSTIYVKDGVVVGERAPNGRFFELHYLGNLYETKMATKPMTFKELKKSGRKGIDF